MSDGGSLVQPSSLSRPPSPPLRPFVERLWIVDRSGRAPASGHERVLPTGGMHLALSLTGEPFRISAETGGSCVAPALVGGARSGPYLRDLSGPRCSAGVQLRPGAGEWLFGVAAAELAEAHTPLDALWGASAAIVLERVADADGPEAALKTLEAELARHLPRLRALHPAVAHALGRLEVACEVGEVVRETGYSHRCFIALFSRAIGLTPKRYGRVLRFRRALRLLAAPAPADLASLAHGAGYSDQAHFSREFRAFAGMSPAEYRRLSPPHPHHVPLTAR